MLENKGVDTVFGYPGGSIISVYDELVDSPIRHILVRHEQCAAHMADGYARAKNQPGVCMATSGPGATNLVTGIATAYADSSPIIALTGQVAAGSLGQGAFQEVDAYSLLMPITKHSYRVLDVNRLPHAVSEAWEICQMGTCRGSTRPYSGSGSPSVRSYSWEAARSTRPRKSWSSRG